VYRLLEVGEVIENGDEHWIDGRWYEWRASVGMKIDEADPPSRRLMKTAVTPAATTPDPGDGWRLLTAGETIQSGDQYSNRVDKDWQKCLTSVSATVEQWRNRLGDQTFCVRRRIEKPAPVVSVGDRVKVLSGPWAGCTGVVVSFEVEVRIHDWNKMTALKDSTPVIRLDHVHVAGSQLIVKDCKVEKLPPVVPEVLYRDLSHGETIRVEDEFLFCGSWRAGSTEPRHIGNKLEKWHVRHRRPVRLQSPDWRYLDAGETVQAGDETSFVLGVPWRDAADYFNLPYVVRDENIPSVNFRRKLPTISGG